MMQTLLLSILRSAAVAVVALVPGTVLAAPASLVSADWLMAHRDDVHVVETAKSVEAFDESGHIEGAPFVAYARLAVEHDTPTGRVRYLLPDPDDFSEVMREAGVNGDDRVVITPSGTSVNGNMTVAARLYWALRYYGHEDVAVAYCNSGHVSAMAWFAINEVGGHSDAALYDGSLHEWTQSRKRAERLLP